MKDIFFLNQKSEPATKADNSVVQDLLDTLKANEAGCLSLEGVRSTTRYHHMTKDEVVKAMQKWGRKYPYAGYGGKSVVGWLYDSLECTREVEPLHFVVMCLRRTS
jgi:hypothetical protein